MINVSLEEALLIKQGEIRALTNMLLSVREENKILKDKLKCSECPHLTKDGICTGKERCWDN